MAKRHPTPKLPPSERAAGERLLPRLSDADVKEFQELMKKVRGIELSYDEAYSSGMGLLIAVDALVHPKNPGKVATHKIHHTPDPKDSTPSQVDPEKDGS
jgi:hypothetical protein